MSLNSFDFRTMKGTVLNEEERLKKLVKDYFGDFVTARKTIEELEKALSDRTYFTEDGSLLLESVATFPSLSSSQSDQRSR